MKIIILTKPTLIALLFLVLFLGCNLVAPKNLLIQNNSKHTIEVTNKNSNQTITIKKGGGDNILSYDEDINIRIFIEKLDYTEEFTVKLNYLETKKIVFDLEKF